MKQYRDFQNVGIDFMAARKTALLADDMGLGKTIQVAGLIDRKRPKRVLVLTLSSLKINWFRELSEWVKKDYKYQILFKVKDILESDAEIIIVNYDLLIYPEIFKQLMSLQYDYLILDEAHNLSNMDAKRTKKVLSNDGLIRNAKHTYALTGTPVRNRPKDFYVMLKVMAPQVIEPYTSYEAYAIRYCGAFMNSYGVLEDKGSSNIEELNEKLSDFMLRRTKEEVLTELPPLIEKTVLLETTDEIADVLAEEERLHEEANDFNPDSELGIQATIRRQLGEAKLNQVYEYIENLLQTEQKIVIFAYHRTVINAIRKRFAGHTVRCVLGGITAKMKQFEVDLFVKDYNSRLFVGQITAAGFGVDGLQKVCNHVVFAEIDWVPGNLEQARDRVRRMGQTKPVMAHYLVVPDTLEDNMLKSVISKSKVITRLLSNTQNKRKGENIMTIESSLDRIAVALETIIELSQQDSQGAETPKKTSTRKSPKKAVEEVTPEPTPVVEAEIVEATPAIEEDDMLGDLDLTPEVEAVALTIDDVKAAFSHFIGSCGDISQGKAKAVEILKKFGYAKIPDIQEKDYAAIINEIKGGK